ncbi:MAG TPA: cell division protein ZapA [Terriglobales bacterium]|nr:cell division protein ZapA [Terriglobales bacterium]
MPAKPSTKVEIYDQHYSLGGDGDADYVRKLAERVDATMRQVARETRVVDSVRVAVLAAIHLADENERLRAQIEEIENRDQSANARARSLSRKLDQVLASSRLGKAG